MEQNQEKIGILLAISIVMFVLGFSTQHLSESVFKPKSKFTCTGCFAITNSPYYRYTVEYKNKHFASSSLFNEGECEYEMDQNPYCRGDK